MIGLGYIAEEIPMADLQDGKVKELLQKKLELSQRIRELKAEAAKLNLELAKSGADIASIASW
jgi:hypothetical protein